MAVFVGGAILGRKGRDVVFRFSESWGGFKKQIPLRRFCEREVLDDLACGGCGILESFKTAISVESQVSG